MRATETNGFVVVVVVVVVVACLFLFCFSVVRGEGGVCFCFCLLLFVGSFFLLVCLFVLRVGFLCLVGSSSSSNPSCVPVRKRTDEDQGGAPVSEARTMTYYVYFVVVDRLIGLVVETSVWRATDLGSVPAFGVNQNPGRVTPVTSKLVIQWLPCQAPGLVGSAVGLVSSVSVFCDWVR